MEEKDARVKQLDNGFYVEFNSIEMGQGNRDMVFYTKQEMLAELVEFFDEKNSGQEVPF